MLVITRVIKKAPTTVSTAVKPLHFFRSLGIVITVGRFLKIDIVFEKQSIDEDDFGGSIN